MPAVRKNMTDQPTCRRRFLQYLAASPLLAGQIYPSPIVLAPTGSNRAFHEDGELAVARAARQGDHLQVLSTVATTSIEQAIEARGRPVWFQLYPTNKWEVTEGLARRAERAGAETIVVTADVIARQNWETLG